MDGFKEKLRNILHSNQFCGICIEPEEHISTLDDSFQIIVNGQCYSKTLKEIVEVVFINAENILTSSQICNSCSEKLIQSYIFIKNAEDSSAIIKKYINDLFNKSDDIFGHLCNSSLESSNVVIVLENNIQGYNDQVKNKKSTIKEELENLKKDASKPKISKFKCLNCNVKLPSNRTFMLHRQKCHKKGLLQCDECLKTFKNKQYLNAHYKVHSKIKCKVCDELIKSTELTNHMQTHTDSIHKCLQCNEEFYSKNALEIHERMRHAKTESNQCLMCFKSFITQDELKLHNCKYTCPECSEHPCMHYKYLMFYREQMLKNASRAKCLDCDYLCRNKEVYLGHVNQEHLNHHPYSCDKCGRQFYSKFVLRTHLHRFHRDTFVCQYCDTEYSNISIYEDHVKFCGTVNRNFACKECPASFEVVDKLLEHEKRRHSNNFPCDQCNKKFSTASKRKDHVDNVHSGIQIKNKVLNVECVVCQKMFDSKGDLVLHMKSHGPNTRYPCRICNTEYETLRQFRAHNRKHGGPFATCEVCGKEMRAILLKKHMGTHRDSVETCETCGRSFANITLLKYHQKVHLESVPCPKCKKLINPARLRRHWKAHLLEENPDLKGSKKQTPKLKCEQCDYITWNNTLLECHMNRHHLKIKPYVCHICSKDFIGKHLLKKHIETHQLDKSVVCMVCLKSFANSACLKMHLRLHTGEKPFTCEVCGDRFRSSSIMNVHKLKKHSDKRNICPLCSNKFHTVRDLRRHVIKVHWKQKNKRFDPRELKGLDKEHYHLFHDGRRVKVAEEDVDFYMPC
ncbi:oocyte zinc finger protein XlCOF6-like isoform X2 [Trichoplusia ni]|nr:oocyte zinc finger protein XlCOF6-like isoform X2 [Trichoplusia ni]XP_026744099.1 oocyte zinc finger protein XlCOF6-like isoform X2 [Trichoplusia ni]